MQMLGLQLYHKGEIGFRYVEKVIVFAMKTARDARLEEDTIIQISLSLLLRE